MKKTNTQKILNFLGKVDEAPATKIHEKTKVPYYLVKFLLRDMEKNGYITSRKSQFGTYTYYTLSENKQLNGGIENGKVN